tara:strand:- start:295 stop:2586 length:2292 start_codon:yes stop_codon:yes gene_type:complete
MDHTTSDLKNISNHFEKVSWKGDTKFTCCCPVHEDKSPSAYVYLNKGWINLGCSSGCDKSDLRRHISDLGYNKKKSKPGTRSKKSKLRPKDSDGFKILMPVPKKYVDRWQTLMHKLHSDCPNSVNPYNYVYPYLNLDGKHQMIITRKDKKDGKDFYPYTLWEKDDQIKWKSKGPEHPKPLYFKKTAEKLKDIEVLHIYEGEKTTNAGYKMFKDSPQILHLTWQGGSKQVGLADWNSLQKITEAGGSIKSIILFPDNDKTGYEAMENVARKLPLIFKTRDIKLLDFSTSPEGWDIADIKPDDVEGIKQLTEAYQNSKLIELTVFKQFTYIKKLDAFYDWEQELLYKSDHFNRILMTDCVFDEKEQRVENSKKFIQASNTDKADKLTFDPQEKKRFSIGGTAYVNSYIPFIVPPVVGDTAWLDEFFEYIAPDPEIRKYLIQWIAHNIRFPGVKIMVAILIYGVEGTGKGTVYQIIRAMLGKDYVKQVKEEQFKDKFTEHLYKRVVLCIDEIKVDYSNRFSMMNKLKNLITEDEFTVDMKGIRPFETKNVVNFLLLTNHDNAITINDRARRFFVLGIHKDPMPSEWYKNIYFKIRTEPGVIKDYFDKVDLTGFDRFAPAPKTKFFNEVVENTKGEDIRTLDTYYLENRWPFNADSNFVCISDLKRGFAKLGIKLSLKILQDWIKSKGGDKIGQIRFGKHRPVIWYIDPNTPRPTELKDVARHYLEPYTPAGEYDTNNFYHLDYEQRQKIDGLSKLDKVSQKEHSLF